jgi:stalled ribosome rescue protein Dom34
MCRTLAYCSSGNLDSASDPKLRKTYVELVEGVQQKGAEVVMFSSMHESGQRMCLNVLLFIVLMMRIQN